MVHVACQLQCLKGAPSGFWGLLPTWMVAMSSEDSSRQVPMKSYDRQASARLMPCTQHPGALSLLQVLDTSAAWAANSFLVWGVQCKTPTMS